MYLIRTLCFLSLFASSLIHGGTPIVLDPNPIVVVPNESNSRVSDEAEIIRNKQKKEVKDNTPTKMERIETKLSVQANQSVDYKMFVQTSLVIPYIFTQPPRKNYTVDLAGHFAMAVRADTNLPFAEPQLWWGLRMASFSGTGTYKESTGRYGYNYIGPLFAWVWFTAPEPKKLPTAAVPAGQRSLAVEFPVYEASMLMGGISFLSVYGEVDRTTPEAQEDFRRNRGIVFDTPSLWFEYNSTSIHFGSLGWAGLFGAQLGSGKTLIWAGVAANGWL